MFFSFRGASATRPEACGRVGRWWRAHREKVDRGEGKGGVIVRQSFIVPLVSLGFAVLAPNVVGAGTVQEMDLPSPVAKEWVFANAAMGRAGPTDIEFCLNLLNRTPKTGYVEYAFFLPSGEDPAFTQDGRELPSAGSIVVTPWRNLQLCFNSPEFPLESPEFFLGWTEIKSSDEVVVTAQVKTRDRQSGETRSAVDLFGNPAPVQRARVQRTTSPAGLALVNPSDEPVQVRLSLGQGSRLDPPEAAIEVAERIVTLPARTQKSFLVGELLGEGGIVVGMEIVGEGVGFGYTGLGFSSTPDGIVGLFLLPAYSQELTRDLFAVEESGGAWDLPVPLQDSLTLGEKWIGITGFGYYVREPGGSVSLFLEPGVQSLSKDETLNLAFVNHYDGKELIFPEAGRMLALPQVGKVQAIRELGGRLVEIEAEQVISTGIFILGLCRHALIDQEDLRVLQLFTYVPNPVSTGGMDCRQTPPWR